MNQITVAFLNKINKEFLKREKRIENSVKELIRIILFNSPTYTSLIGGELRGHFGFPKGMESVFGKKLLDDLINTIKIEITPFTIIGNNIAGKVVIKVVAIDEQTIIRDYQQYIVDLSGRKVQMKDEKGKETGELLPWVEWLFLRGEDNLIEYYHIIKGGGRSTLNRMERGGVWKIPGNHSGVQSDNWVTRAINANDGEIKRVIKKHLSLKG